MPLIQLPTATVKLITSSQVITSVSSVVKELVENALDAGATGIDVKLEENGLSKIEVKDDGCGIHKDDMKNVCLPSYTSKIEDFHDLDSLLSYGFRGEALSALCQVSDVTITTRTADDQHAATHVLNKNGGITSSKLSHHDVGTIIAANNLFKNLPVRKQYFKSGRRANDELKRAECVVKSLAVINPSLRITFCHNKHLVWKKSSAPNLRESLMQVVGYKIAAKLEELSVCLNQVSIIMLVPQKDLSTLIVQSSADSIIIFINKRPVKHKKLEKILVKTLSTHFEGQIPPQKYPHCLISIDVTPSNLDVNLEPNKSRVLFKDEDQVLEQVERLLLSYYEVKVTVEKPETSDAMKSRITATTSSDREKIKFVDGTMGETEIELDDWRLEERDVCTRHQENSDANRFVVTERRDAATRITYDGEGHEKSNRNEHTTSEYSSTNNGADCQADQHNTEQTNQDPFTNQLSENWDSTIDSLNLEIVSDQSNGRSRSFMKFSNKEDNALHKDQSETIINQLELEASKHVPLESKRSEIIVPQRIDCLLDEEETEPVTKHWNDQTNTTHLSDQISANKGLWNDDEFASEKVTSKPTESNISNQPIHHVPAVSDSEWEEIDKASKEWGFGNISKGPSAANLKSTVLKDVTKDKWSAGQVRTANGRLLQGSCVLLPTTATHSTPSPNSSGDRSVCSQMGQKENSAFTKFTREMRPQIFQEYPGIEFTKVAGLMVSKWRALNEEERARYEDMAREAGAEKKRKGSFKEQYSEMDPKKKKEKIEYFQNLLNKSIEVSPKRNQATETEKRNEQKRVRKEVRMEVSVEDLTRRLTEDKKCHNESPEFSIIGQLKPSQVWMYRQGTEIGIIRHWGLQEVVLCDKLMKNHVVPLTPLEYPTVIDERKLGPELWKLLLSLDKSYNGFTKKVTISSPYISKNGFSVEVNEDVDQVSCLLTAVPSVSRFYGIPELRETLQLLLENGPDCTLNRCRPLKIVNYLEADAVRMTRESPSLNRESLDELLTYWHLHINKDEYTCLHHKPIFTAIHQLADKSKPNAQQKWENILLHSEK